MSVYGGSASESDNEVAIGQKTKKKGTDSDLRRRLLAKQKMLKESAHEQIDAATIIYEPARAPHRMSSEIRQRPAAAKQSREYEESYGLDRRRRQKSESESISNIADSVASAHNGSASLSDAEAVV